MAFSDPVSFTGIADWELCWAPYDSATYQVVLNQLRPEDVVLEIGAGDLRLARQIAMIARKVYAVEVNAQVLELGLNSTQPLPGNLFSICADAQKLDFPADVTVGVLLMRHSTHFQLYAENLKSKNCEKLITNARWHMDVECVHLHAPRIKFEQIEMGWYACWCGKVGFKCGPVEKLTPASEAIIHEVSNCPGCLQQ